MILLVVPFGRMLHCPFSQQIEGNQTVALGGDTSPLTASTFCGFRIQSTCTAKRAFFHCTGLPVPASAGMPSQRGTSSTEQVVLQMAALERSIERFGWKSQPCRWSLWNVGGARISLFDHACLNGNRRAVINHLRFAYWLEHSKSHMYSSLKSDQIFESERQSFWRESTENRWK